MLNTLLPPPRSAAALLMAVGVLAGCGGGGGGDAPPPSPPAEVRIAVQNADVVNGQLPLPTATADAPTLEASSAAVSDVDASDSVDLPLTIESADGVAAILARVPGDATFFQVNNPALTEEPGTGGKALARTVFSGSIRMLVPADFNAAQFCLDIAAVDLLGRVSNYDRLCFVVPAQVGAGTVTANAGADRSARAGTTVTLNGFAQQRGTAAAPALAWSQIAGPTVTLSNPTTATPSFTAPNGSALQTLEFRLIATGTGAQTDSDSLKVYVLGSSNQAPTVNAGNDQTINERTPASLGGLAADADGTATVAWTQVSGPAVTLSASNVRTPTFTAPAVNGTGVAVLRLTATDNSGIAVNDTVSITINDPAPQANAASFTVAAGSTLNGSLASFASDAAGDALNFAVASAPTAGTLNLSPNGTFSFVAPASAGSVTFGYRVNDGAADSAVATVSVTVTAAPAFTPVGDWHFGATSVFINGPKGVSFPFGRFATFAQINPMTITSSASGLSFALQPPYDFIGSVDQLQRSDGTYDPTFDPPALDTTSPASTLSGVFENGALSIIGGYSTSVVFDGCSNCGGVYDFVRNLPRVNRLVPAGNDVIIGQRRFHSETFGTVDTNADGNGDREDGSRPGRDDVTLTSYVFVRRATDFVASRLNGQYAVATQEYAVQASGGDRSMTSTFATWALNGAGGASETAYRELRATRLANPGAAQRVGLVDSGEVNASRGRSATLGVTTSGRLTADLLAGTSTLANAKGFASPDGEFFFLAWSRDDSAGSCACLRQGYLVAVRTASAAPAVNGRSLRLAGTLVDWRNRSNGVDSAASGVAGLVQLRADLGTTSGTFVVRDAVHTPEAERISDNSGVEVHTDDSGFANEPAVVSTAPNGRLRMTLGDAAEEVDLFGALSSSGNLFVGLFDRREYADATRASLLDLERGLVLGMPSPASTRLDNRAPRVSLAASSTSVGNGQPVNLTATANDPDSGPGALAVSWQARVGVLSANTGTTTTWTAPASGSGAILVDAIASDGDRSTVGSLVICYGPSPCAGGDPSVKRLPSGTFAADGNLTDWNGIPPVVSDAASDQNGNTSTDLRAVYAAVNGANMVVRMDVTGPMLFPHTPAQSTSHYELALSFYRDAACSDRGTPARNFYIVNNFTTSGGGNFHMLDDYVSSDTSTTQHPTTTAASGSSLETSFSTSVLPTGLGYTHMSFLPYVQSFDGASVATQHDGIADSVGCFAIP